MFTTAVQARKLESPTLLTYMSRLFREGALLLILTVALLGLLALASYSPTDPGWSYFGQETRVDNLVGRVGAWFADVFFYLFGLAAFLFPLMFAWFGWNNFCEKMDGKHASIYLSFLRSIGSLMAVISATLLATLQFSEWGLSMPIGSGGVMGSFLAGQIVPSFNPVGSSLVALTAFLFGITLYTGLSWIALMESIGGMALWLYRKAVGSDLAQRDWFEQHKETRNHLDTVMEEREPENPYAPKKMEPIFEDDPLSSPGKIEPTLKPHIPTEIRKEEVLRPEPIVHPRIDPKPENQLQEPTMELQAPKEQLKIEPMAEPIDFSTRVEREKQAPLFADLESSKLPPLFLLDEPEASVGGYSPEVIEEMSRQVEIKLKDFGVKAEVTEVHPGPVVTLFELQLAPGTKASKVTGLSNDLARSLSKVSVRVVEVIPGKTTIGLEIPNESRETVFLSEVLRSKDYDKAKSLLTIAMGKDISGNPVVADLAKMPHALIAGTTGSGKSVAINAMILSLLYKATPEEVRMIMVDPKMLELSVYEGIPHLLTPVVTDMKEAANALRWCVAEMERRYKLMASQGVRNVAGYNRKVREAAAAGEPIKDPFFEPNQLLEVDQEHPDLEPLPYIVVVIDELADMMMVVGKKVEELIARLAQKARAAGIHLLLATQRPSVDVITGLIKANIPTRLAFQVSSRIDSRTIIDQMGAEHLLGNGDGLYMAPGGGPLRRVHGAFVDDHEVHNVVEHLKKLGQPNYIEEIIKEPTEAIPGLSAEASGVDTEDADPLYDEAVQFVIESRRASISSVQRRLKVGYNRAARLIEEMERVGIVSPPEHNGNRQVLVAAPEH